MPGYFSEQHIESIRKLSKWAITGKGYAEFSKQFWFAYFWENARDNGDPSLFHAKKDIILQFFQEMFWLPEEWDEDSDKHDRNHVPTRMRTKLPGTWNQIEDFVLYKMLLALLNIGFIRVPASQDRFYSADPSIDVSRYSLTFDLSRKVELGWRGDGRSLEEITRAGGMINKSESEGYAIRVNMRQPWNPFNYPDNQVDYFYRRYKTDNCLFSVVSISTSFETSATFPMMEDKLISFPKAGGIAVVPASLDAIAANPKKESFAKVIGSAGAAAETSVVRVADRQQLYLVVLEGGYFNTKAMQEEVSRVEGFPEIAVKRVPARNILGCVVFTRVFHGTTDDEGLTVLFDPLRSTAPTMERCLQVTGDEGRARKLFAAAEPAFKAAGQTFSVKWTKERGVRVPPFAVNGQVFNIRRVITAAGKTLWVG